MKKLRVLLVDDEIMIREGFKRLSDWEAHGCEVVGEAADGMEALTRIDTLDPDIVIMDINIPIMNGLKVIQLSRIKHPETAFVIVSGYDDFSYCREALRLQITDYILKPVNYEEFGSCIDNLKIALFQRQSSKNENRQEERVITGITRYLQEHLAEDISLAILAEQFHLNAQYISQLFKSEIGVGFLTYLTNIRMEKAKSSCCPPHFPSRRWRNSPATAITGYLPKCSRSRRASPPPSTGGISWRERQPYEKWFGHWDIWCRFAELMPGGAAVMDMSGSRRRCPEKPCCLLHHIFKKACQQVRFLAPADMPSFALHLT